MKSSPSSGELISGRNIQRAGDNAAPVMNNHGRRSSDLAERRGQSHSAALSFSA
jgi:hypothetical protein